MSDFPETFSSYTYVRKIGSGAGGVVHEVKWEGKIYAIKAADIKPSGISYTSLLEMDILRRVNHPNIVNAKKIFIEDNYLYIVMEYATLDLWSWIYEDKGDPNDVFNVLIDMLQGIEFLHKHDIIHGDIKPENILIFARESGERPAGSVENKRGKTKIADFGLVQRDVPSSKRLNGTMEYMAPELLALNRNFSKAVDIWAFGIIVYNIIFKLNFIGNILDDHKKRYRYLFYYLSEEKVPSIYTELKVSPSYGRDRGVLVDTPDRYIERAKEVWGKNYDILLGIAKCCLRFNPNERITATELLDILSSSPSPSGIYDEGKLISSPLPISNTLEDQIYSWVEEINKTLNYQYTTLIFAFDLFERYLSFFHTIKESDLKGIVGGCLLIAVKMCEMAENTTKLERVFGFGIRTLNIVSIEREIVTTLDFVLYVDNLETICKKDPKNTFLFMKNSLLGKDRNSYNLKRLRSRKFLELCESIEE